MWIGCFAMQTSSNWTRKAFTKRERASMYFVVHDGATAELLRPAGGDANGVTPAPGRRSGSSRCPVCPVRVARITWVTIPAAFFPRCKAMHLEQGGRDEHAEQSCSDYGCRQR